MNGKRLIEKIRLRNILSFGDKGEEITLEPLNIIVGQNASGKSNLIEIFHLLQDAAFGHISERIKDNGGISQYLWRASNKFPIAEIGVFLSFKEIRKDLLFYGLKFKRNKQNFEIVEEEITPENKLFDDDFYYSNKNAVNNLVYRKELKSGKEEIIVREEPREKSDSTKSILGTLPETYNTFDVIYKIKKFYRTCLQFNGKSFLL